ncbi:hypothetical protein ASE75_06020 [Sphingomonas sp. Leaf17]|uniref:hypothetical protein n=1 Tax=Sphingomonas sp. Leaf17 TaxID=1735683 RepID=UPI0007010A81|nr:hypothetical protein [Sphingomonas sp. Leaf17]KQM65785.1 hypothetical protein ASE75_06020 [Sphingomonas sp. Leaf17]
MPTALPTLRQPKSATLRPMDFGAWQSPTGPGAAQRLERLGSRFALDIMTGRLRWVEDRRAWIGALLRGISDTVLYPVSQPGLVIGNPGAPRIAGGGQAGQVLALTGFAAGYVMRESQAVSIIIGGQRYLYAATAETAADGSGAMALPVWPPVRRSPAADAVCEVAVPMIEGSLSGNDKGWTDERAHTVGLTLTITEIE